MSSNTVDIPHQDAENCPPSETSSTNGLPISNPPSIKPKSYMKQRGRRRRWWYFNRGLQPISELAEIKDVKDDAVKCENPDDSPTIQDNSYVINNYSPTDNTIITSDSTQNKENYSACLKLIEKFQEVVMDSAVRVIQAAFKRFRERRRFLRIKRAVMVIQRNLRKWLETKHPCIRPADFERQSSDGSKSDEYRETVENESENRDAEEKCDQMSDNESEKCEENDTNGNSEENNTADDPQECALDVENVNGESELCDKAVDVEPNCSSELHQEETVESNTGQDKKSITTSAESEHEEIIRDVKSLLEEMLTKVTSNFTDSDFRENQPEESKDLTTPIDTTDICSSFKLTPEDEDITETQENSLNKTNIDVTQEDLNCENENHSKTTAGDDEKEEYVSNVSPDSLKGICQKFLVVSEISNPHHMQDEES